MAIQSNTQARELADPIGDTFDYEDVISELSKPEFVHQAEEAQQIEANSVSEEVEGGMREVMGIWTKGQGDIHNDQLETNFRIAASDKTYERLFRG